MTQLHLRMPHHDPTLLAEIEAPLVEFYGIADNEGPQFAALTHQILWGFSDDRQIGDLRMDRRLARPVIHDIAKLMARPWLTIDLAPGVNWRPHRAEIAQFIRDTADLTMWRGRVSGLSLDEYVAAASLRSMWKQGGMLIMNPSGHTIRLPVARGSWTRFSYAQRLVPYFHVRNRFTLTLTPTEV